MWYNKKITYYNKKEWLTIEIPTEQVKQNLKTWLTVFDSDVILEAMNRTQSKGKSFVYLNAILTDFKQKEVKTEYGIENVPLVHCFLPLSAKKCTSKCDAVTISNNKSDNNDHKVN